MTEKSTSLSPDIIRLVKSSIWSSGRVNFMTRRKPMIRPTRSSGSSFRRDSWSGSMAITTSVRRFSSCMEVLVSTSAMFAKPIEKGGEFSLSTMNASFSISSDAFHGEKE